LEVRTDDRVRFAGRFHPTRRHPRPRHGRHWLRARTGSLGKARRHHRTRNRKDWNPQESNYLRARTKGALCIACTRSRKDPPPARLMLGCPKEPTRRNTAARASTASPPTSITSIRPPDGFVSKESSGRIVSI